MADSKEIFRDAVHTAHELLHQGKVDEAHEILHKAMLGDPTSMKAPIENEVQFDKDFRDVCLKNGIEASYLRFVEQGRDARGVSMALRTGGNQRQVCLLEMYLTDTGMTRI